jgi:hypothetical protein
MPECEVELKFYLSGKVEGETERASEVIEVLGLNNKAIREERRRLVDNLIYIKESQPDKLVLLGDESLNDLLDELGKPDDSEVLPAYSPALVNIIRGILLKA